MCGSPRLDELVGRWILLPSVLLMFPIAGSESDATKEWIFEKSSTDRASATRTDQTGVQAGRRKPAATS
jgi:hypothetical protein